MNFLNLENQSFEKVDFFSSQVNIWHSFTYQPIHFLIELKKIN